MADQRVIFLSGFVFLAYNLIVIGAVLAISVIFTGNKTLALVGLGLIFGSLLLEPIENFTRRLRRQLK